MFNAKSKCRDTGYDLSYDKKYIVTLDEVTDLYDWDVRCDFSGWNSEDLRKRKRFHKMASLVSRYPGKKLFTLVGVVSGHKIDLGHLWKNAGKRSFELILNEVFPEKEVCGRLFVYLNDVHGFYWNNKGSYKIDIQ